MKRYGLLLGLFLMTQFLFAQQNETVTGKVIDEQGNPLPYCTVSILNAQDQGLITGDVTNDQGVYTMTVPPGQYKVRYQFVSYQTITKDLTVGNGTTNLSPVTLKETADKLSEVVVKGKRTEMEMKLDKKVFNIGSDLTSQGGNASDILDRLPSVSVDVDGNINLRGSANVRILINGKPSGLVGIDPATALRQLQADMIEKIEVITNPSARYEAEGNAGIINIILKKEKNSGLNGSFSVNTGYPQNHGISANLNFRKNWINFFGSYGVGYRESVGGGLTKQRFTHYDTLMVNGQELIKDSLSYTDINRDMNRSGFSQNARVGADFYLNDKNTITVSGLYRTSAEDNLSDITYDDYDSNRSLINKTLRHTKEGENESAFEYSLNYTKLFDKDDHKFTADIQYQENSDTEDSNIKETYDGKNAGRDPLFQHTLNDEFESNLLMQASYVHPFTKDKKFEAGARSTIRHISNDYYVEQQNEQGQYTKIPEFTNNFNYDEGIHALYAIYGDKMGALSYQLGIRSEYTSIQTQLGVASDSINKREYLNFFPSIHLTYNFSKENAVQISYSRRFNRPRFWWLNPFYSYTDNRNIRSGNPNLEPEFTDSYEMGFLRNWAHGSFYSGAYYRHTTGEVDRISTVIDSITYSIPRNLSVENSIGLEANLSQDFFKWWKFNGNIDIFHSEKIGSYMRAVANGEEEKVDLSAKTFSFRSRISTTLTFWKDFDFQLSGYYRAPENRTQGKRKAMYTLDLALGKPVLHDKGNLSLSVRDVFNSRKWRSITQGDNFYYDSEFQWRGRQILLTFDYRLRRNNKKGQGRKRGQGEGDFNGGDQEGY